MHADQEGAPNGGSRDEEEEAAPLPSSRSSLPGSATRRVWAPAPPENQVLQLFESRRKCRVTP
jgi:hypothetical protein